jgi:hypothetical protein
MMHEGIARGIATGALLLGIPVACLAGVALYGKALSDGDVAIGTLVSPEVAARRLAESRARFLAMPPAAHLAAARAALYVDGDPARPRRGGARAALEHLAAIPDGAVDRAELDALRAEVLARRARWAQRRRQRADAGR